MIHQTAAPKRKWAHGRGICVDGGTVKSWHDLGRNIKPGGLPAGKSSLTNIRNQVKETCLHTHSRDWVNWIRLMMVGRIPNGWFWYIIAIVEWRDHDGMTDSN